MTPQYSIVILLIAINFLLTGPKQASAASIGPTCPPDKPQVNCFVDPCLFATCPAHPDATCVADYCGGCFATFFDEDDNEVTDSCDCPVIGQLFTDCGSACPANCTDPYPFCTKQCVARCECPDGEVINEATNKCVPVEECLAPEGGVPAVCPIGQVFNLCGSPCTGTCADPNPICTLPCVPRCECPKDRVLDEDTGTCIPLDQCPVSQ